MVSSAWFDSPETIIAVVVGFVNFLALLFVSWQTRLTRRSVQLSEGSLYSNRRLRELSNLPKAHFRIHVEWKLRKWKADLQRMIDDEGLIRNRIKLSDPSLGEDYGLASPERLVDRFIYERAPDWLSITLVTAAQYYYNCKSGMWHLSQDKAADFKLRLLPGTIGTAREGVQRLDEMLSYIETSLPQWYLNSPASLNDDRFL